MIKLDQYLFASIQIIYRVVSKAYPKSNNSNKLFDMIMKSISKYCLLFSFLDLHKLLDDRLDDLYEIYSNSAENTHQYFNYMKCNLHLIRETNKRKKKLIESNDELKNKIDELDFKITSLHKQFSDSEKANNNLQNQLNDSK
ncbi:hypothetical protein M9Y10_000557 [Tritrichomonas musculus]|uniref:Uncharacterized protein n=1 Tax=Tritrichomonas musculus TaxID=1915356 RepID=A0ABR2L5G3_9EUKA